MNAIERALRYNDLYYDYERQRDRNHVYLKPKNAVTSWKQPAKTKPWHKRTTAERTTTA